MRVELLVYHLNFDTIIVKENIFIFDWTYKGLKLVEHDLIPNIHCFMDMNRSFLSIFLCRQKERMECIAKELVVKLHVSYCIRLKIVRIKQLAGTWLMIIDN